MCRLVVVLFCSFDVDVFVYMCADLFVDLFVDLFEDLFEDLVVHQIVITIALCTCENKRDAINAQR